MTNDHIRGWLFFNPNRSNLSFVADGERDYTDIPWRVLLDQIIWKNFAQKFSPRKTEQKDTRLEGYYLDVAEPVLMEWFEQNT